MNTRKCYQGDDGYLHISRSGGHAQELPGACAEARGIVPRRSYINRIYKQILDESKRTIGLRSVSNSP